MFSIFRWSMENQKRRLVILGDEDIITNLSEDLINPILERLPVKDAVRTCVLSKKWRYRWTTMRALDLHHQFSRQFLKVGAYHHHGLIRVINHIVIHHMGPILKFHLYIPKRMLLDSFQEVDQWMLIVSRNNVRDLDIVNANRIYQIPSCVFSCLELRMLVLYKCIFKPPLEFHGFPNLEDIVFCQVNFGGNLGGSVFNFPQLKKLKMCWCRNVGNFKIKAQKLRTLEVISCHNAMLLQLLHSEILDVVCICFCKLVVDFRQVKRFNLPTMLSRLPNIVTFTIDGYFLKFLAIEKFPKRLPYEIKCLKRLELERFSFGDLDQVQGAICMLLNSPTLEELLVEHVSMGPNSDLELTSNYLESPECVDQALFMLQAVEMTSLDGSRSELLFLKLLLDHSPHLENIIIRPRAMTDAQNMLKIAKEVMLFPRASTKAKIVYLDPEP